MTGAVEQSGGGFKVTTPGTLLINNTLGTISYTAPSAAASSSVGALALPTVTILTPVCRSIAKPEGLIDAGTGQYAGTVGRSQAAARAVPRPDRPTRPTPASPTVPKIEDARGIGGGEGVAHEGRDHACRCRRGQGDPPNDRSDGGDLSTRRRPVR